MKVQVKVKVTVNTCKAPFKYALLSPKGYKFKVRNMKAFCEHIGLDQSAMTKVCKGKLNHHKGWRGVELDWKAPNLF